MLLYTVSFLVCLALANSSGQRKQLVASESRAERDVYSVPQDIRDRVPVDFAAMNLRKSRLEGQTDRNGVRNRPEVEEEPKATINQPKRVNAIKNSTKQSKQWKHKAQKRKRPTDIKLAGYKKSPRFRMDNSHEKSTSTNKPDIPSKDTSIEAANVEKNTLQSQMQTTQNPNAFKQSEGNSFENIKKAINALPQQMVKVVRDDTDCNDDPTKSIQNTRGPPCTFSYRWPTTGGHSPFWGNNVYPQNWGIFADKLG